MFVYKKFEGFPVSFMIHSKCRSPSIEPCGTSHLRNDVAGCLLSQIRGEQHSCNINTLIVIFLVYNPISRSTFISKYYVELYQKLSANINYSKGQCYLSSKNLAIFSTTKMMLVI